MTALAWSPFATEADARRVAACVIEEGLVACANIIPGLMSVFAWEGSVDECCEVGVLFKTDARLLERAVQRIAELHPYSTPAVVGWRCDAAATVTSEWLQALYARNGTIEES